MSFLDNESVEKKINAGHCRILRTSLPQNIKEYLDNENNLEGIFEFLKRDDKHYYFYWMVDNPLDINNFIDKYTIAYEKRYELIKKVLQGE